MAKLIVRNDSGGTIYLENWGHQEVLDTEQQELAGNRRHLAEDAQLETLIDSGDLVVIDSRGNDLPIKQAQWLREGFHDDQIEERATLRTAIYGKAAAGTISKGDPVYVSAYNPVTDEYTFEIADSDAATFPAMGVANGDTITTTVGGSVVVEGIIEDIDTSAWTVGDSLYVSPTGTLTDVRPVGIANKIQSVARVMYVHATDGVILVVGAGRGNEIPNLTQGKVWRGDADDHPEEADVEPAFAKNTAFNKDFGTSAGTVAEGDHTHTGGLSAMVSENVAYAAEQTVTITATDTWTDVPNSSFTITTEATAPIWALATFNGKEAASSSKSWNARLMINGVGGPEVFQHFESDIKEDSSCQMESAALAAGTYTVKLQVKNNINTANMETLNLFIEALSLAGAAGPAGADGADGAPGSGSTLIVKEEGTNVANTPHSAFNFIGDKVTVTDAGAGVADVTVEGGGFGSFVETTIAKTSGNTTINPSNTPTSSDGTQIVTSDITPAAASNKVLVTFNFMCDISGDVGFTTLVIRDSTIVGLISGQGMTKRAKGGFVTGTFIDSPNTASQVTYSLRVGSESGDWYIGQRVDGKDHNNMADDYSKFTLTEMVF